MAAELTPPLAALANDREQAEQSLEIVLELVQQPLQQSGSRAERIATQRASFRSVADPVRVAVAESGGSVQDEVWINGTIKARIPASALNQLRNIDGILRIDVPRALVRDSEG